MRADATRVSAASDSYQDDSELLYGLQRETFEYFLNEITRDNGLVSDTSRPGWPASITATGLALASYPVAVERGFMTRASAADVTRTTLRFFHQSVQSPTAEATGYRGFYYHFLDRTSGRRAWRSELSTIDSTFLLAGALTAAAYFDRDAEIEQQIRRLADDLYRRVDWQWAQDGGASVTHGWKPESGFLKYRWEGFNEALLLYVLGLGSPTHPLPSESYLAWLSSYTWKEIYGCGYVYAGPLFTHQLSHIWIDFRGLQDAYMRARGIDYFENSRRATRVQQQYAIRNPREFASYSRHCWGITASDGPGPATLPVNGRERQFFGYTARGVPFGPDDGTLAPWAAVASLPFAPEIVLPTIRHFTDRLQLRRADAYGFTATFNQTYPERSDHSSGWVSPWHFGLNQGPIVLMIENHQSGLVWRLMKRCTFVIQGLRRAGFTGGWL